MALDIEICWINAESDIAKSLESLWADENTIVNAPRPISGDKAWEGDWLKGCHYAAGKPIGSTNIGRLMVRGRFDRCRTIAL